MFSATAGTSIGQQYNKVEKHFYFLEFDEENKKHTGTLIRNVYDAAVDYTEQKLLKTMLTTEIFFFKTMPIPHYPSADTSVMATSLSFSLVFFKYVLGKYCTYSYNITNHTMLKSMFYIWFKQVTDNFDRHLL
jgi:hypothetical protein